MVYKCKNCGGNLIINESSPYAVCESCGSQQSYPKISSDEIAEAYNQGNLARLRNNYSQALNVFSNLVTRNPNDSEARWNCVLCEYGINYQEDPRTHEKIPYINRTSYNSVLENENYLKALELADPSDRYYYETEADKIETLRKKSIEIANKTKPYDVFICFKDSEIGFGSKRTNDSVLGQKLYDELTKDKYKVFFSRITLKEQYAGDDYEPHIFSALNSAKVMVVIGTKLEYVNYEWVKNEWTRFLSYMEKDSSKRIIPVFEDNINQCFPAELAKLQGFNSNNPGWELEVRDLVRRVVGDKKEKVQEKIIIQEKSDDYEKLIEDGKFYKRNGDYTKAQECIEKAIQLRPRDYRAYDVMIQYVCDCKLDKAFPYIKKLFKTDADDTIIDNLIRNHYSNRFLVKLVLEKQLPQYIKNRESYIKETEEKIPDYDQSIESRRKFLENYVDEYAESKKTKNNAIFEVALSVLSVVLTVFFTLGKIGVIDDALASTIEMVVCIISGILGLLIGGILGGIVGYLGCGIVLSLCWSFKNIGIIAFIIISIFSIYMLFTTSKDNKIKNDEIDRQVIEKRNRYQKELQESIDKREEFVKGVEQEIEKIKEKIDFEQKAIKYLESIDDEKMKELAYRLTCKKIGWEAKSITKYPDYDEQMINEIVKEYYRIEL